jgi:hypothetical protein
LQFPNRHSYYATLSLDWRACTVKSKLAIRDIFVQLASSN